MQLVPIHPGGATSNLQLEATLATPRDGVVTVDITPPRWDHGGGEEGDGGGKPSATAVTSVDFTVTFGLSEPGEVFWAGGPTIHARIFRST